MLNSEQSAAKYAGTSSLGASAAQAEVAIDNAVTMYSVQKQAGPVMRQGA